MTMRAINDFLILTGGAPAKALDNMFFREETVGSAFFKPYKSTAGFFIQLSSVVAAPISLTIQALEMMLVSIVLIPVSIIDVCLGNTDGAADSIVYSGKFFLASLTAILAAIVSPLVNLIDLIGSGCVSIADACQDEEKTAAGSMGI